MAKRKKRKESRKYRSKYYREYGYSVGDVCKWIGWSYGTVWAYFQEPAKRKEMLDLVKIEERNKE